MKLSNEQLLFFVEVLQDSLEVPKAYAYDFRSSHDKRSKFYQEFLSQAIINFNSETIDRESLQRIIEKHK